MIVSSLGSKLNFCWAFSGTLFFKKIRSIIVDILDKNIYVEKV